MGRGLDAEVTTACPDAPPPTGRAVALEAGRTTGAAPAAAGTVAMLPTELPEVSDIRKPTRYDPGSAPAVLPPTITVAFEMALEPLAEAATKADTPATTVATVGSVAVPLAEQRRTRRDTITDKSSRDEGAAVCAIGVDTALESILQSP